MITSTLSIDSAGICCKPVVPDKPTSPEGFPFINILTLLLPLNDTFPSMSTETDGTLSKTSATLPPLTVISLPTLYILLSNLISTSVLSAIKSTFSNWSISISSLTVSRSVLVFIVKFSIENSLKEINSILTLYFPLDNSILKSPFLSVIPPSMLLGLFILIIDIVAYSRGCNVSESTTLPFKINFDWKSGLWPNIGMEINNVRTK